MLNIFTSVGRAPVDGADAQSRLSSNGEGAKSDSDGSGFDDVFSQVNGSAATPSGTLAFAARPPVASNAAQPNGAAPRGLADLLANAKTGTNGAAVLKPVDAARALAALASTDDATASVTTASDLDAANPVDGASSALDLITSSPSNGQPAVNLTTVPSALTTLAELVGSDAKGQTAAAVSTPESAPAARRSKPVDTTNAATLPTMDATDAILAALLGAPAPAPAPIPGGASKVVAAPQTVGKKAANVTVPSAEDDIVSDLPDRLVDPAEPTDASSLEPVPSTLLDAQVALRPAEADRTLVSVVAQATHFPVVERLSLSQQLAAPIAEAATALADAPTTSASTAPMRTLDVTLSPGDLGSVTISMRLVDGDLHLGVEAQEAGTARLIERDKATLANALHASGYSVADLTIVHGAEAGGQTQSGSNNASQDQRAASGSDTSGSDTSRGGAESNDQAFARDRAPSQQGRSNGDGGSAAPGRTERGVYV